MIKLAPPTLPLLLRRCVITHYTTHPTPPTYGVLLLHIALPTLPLLRRRPVITLYTTYPPYPSCCVRWLHPQPRKEILKNKFVWQAAFKQGVGSPIKYWDRMLPALIRLLAIRFSVKLIPLKRRTVNSIPSSFFPSLSASLPSSMQIIFYDFS
jgi:hypothetical protein